MIMRVYLNSGAHFDIPVTEYSVERNKVTHEFVGLNWTHKPGSDAGLSYVRIESVAAVLRIEDQP